MIFSMIMNHRLGLHRWTYSARENPPLHPSRAGRCERIRFRLPSLIRRGPGGGCKSRGTNPLESPLTKGDSHQAVLKSVFSHLQGNHCGSDRGVILIALLWVLAALSLLALNLAATVRIEVGLAQASGESEKAYFYARGGLEKALYHLFFPNPDPDKQKALFPYGAGMNHYWMSNEEMVCHVAILDEAGKIDLNFAYPETIVRLLENLGVQSSLGSSIAAAVVEWRTPKTAESNEAYGDFDRVKHRPFDSVEELLQVPGVSREILYGAPQRRGDGKIVNRRGLAEFVTVYSKKSQVNMNYAEREVVAALPGLNLNMAALIVQARKTEPFKTSSDLSERVPGIIRGEALSLMASDLSSPYCLVATAFVKGSKARRSIKVVVKREEKLKSRHERLIWYDDYWPTQQVLRWTDFKSAADKNLTSLLALSLRGGTRDHQP